MSTEIQQYERRIQKLLESRERYKLDARNALKASREWEVAYKELYRHCKYMGKPNGLIIHLEEHIELLDTLIRKYQRHYAQYGHFYTEWENTKSGKRKPIPEPTASEGDSKEPNT